MLHEMKLYEGPFGRMKKGSKKLELRLYDEKRQKIKIGDEIIFRLAPNLNEEIKTKVTGLLVYPKFADMLDDLPTSLLGYDEKDRDYLRTSMYEVYSPEQEATHGALGIRIEHA